MDFRLAKNQSENGKYNLISDLFNKWPVMTDLNWFVMISLVSLLKSILVFWQEEIAYILDEIYLFKFVNLSGWRCSKSELVIFHWEFSFLPFKLKVIWSCEQFFFILITKPMVFRWFHNRKSLFCLVMFEYLNKIPNSLKIYFNS